MSEAVWGDFAMIRLLRLSEIVSAIALLFSVYNFWQNSQRPPELRIFVPPVIDYASGPYPDSKFEAFAIPVTVVNQGARTGTILSMVLTVTDPKNNTSKRFYSANVGPYSQEKLRNGDRHPFAPISLAGRTSYTDTVQFLARGDQDLKPIVQAAGNFQFAITVDSPKVEYGFFDQMFSKVVVPLNFEMVLQELDRRLFITGDGTIAMHEKDWQSTAGE
jgi:hypothetical protein